MTVLFFNFKLLMRGVKHLVLRSRLLLFVLARYVVRITFLIESHPCEHHFTCRVNNTSGQQLSCGGGRRPPSRTTWLLPLWWKFCRTTTASAPCPILFNTACIIIYYKGRTGLDVTRIPKCNFACCVCCVCVQNSETGTTQYSMSAAAVGR